MVSYTSVEHKPFLPVYRDWETWVSFVETVPSASVFVDYSPGCHQYKERATAIVDSVVVLELAYPTAVVVLELAYSTAVVVLELAYPMVVELEGQDFAAMMMRTEVPDYHSFVD